MFNEKHTYYHTCPLCGANLDPDESCDCQNDNTDSNVTEKSEDHTIDRKEEPSK
jgi:hypothetical protein